MAIKITLDFCSFKNNPPLTQQSRLQNLKQGYQQYDILSSLFLKFFFGTLSVQSKDVEEDVVLKQDSNNISLIMMDV